MKKIFSKLFKTKKNNSSYSQAYVNNQLGNRYFSNNYFSLAKNGFTDNIIAFRSINMIAKSASSVNLLAYKKNQTSGKQEELASHMINDLLKQPSQKYGLAEFIEEIVSYQLISGNAYIYAAKDNDNMPTELQILRPDRIKILNNNDYIVYQYTINRLEYNFSDDINGLCDILHIKNFHPLDDLYGLSTLFVVRNAIDQHNQCLEWNRSLLHNGARPSGAIVMNSNSSMTEEQFDRMKSQINDQVIGGENAGKIMLLEGGLDWKEMSMSPKDMDFLESKNGSARDIALAFGVPPQLLGIPGDNKYNNMGEAKMMFWEETVLPILNNLCNKLSIWLSGHFMENITIRYDIDSVSALSERRQILWQNLNNTTFLSDGEKREMLGFNSQKKLKTTDI